MKRWLIFLTTLGLLATYTYFKMNTGSIRNPLVTMSVTAGLFLWMFGPHFFLHAHPGSTESSLFRVVLTTGSILMGAWATFILLWLVVDSGRVVMSLFSSTPLSPRIPLAIVVVSLLVAFVGFVQASMGPRLKHVTIPVDDLPPGLEGKRIVQISDLHIGPGIGRGYVERVVAEVQKLNPDLVAVTGDLVDGSVATLGNELEPLRQLRAPLGVYFVTGNHEYFWGAEEWVAKVKELGLDPLLNENRTVRVDGTQLLVAGVTDFIGEQFVPSHRSDPTKAAQTDKRPGLKLLLAHRPNSATEAEPAGFDLQLSGHTHGGQFFPFSWVVPLFQRYHRGLYRHGRMWVYVNTGTGFWGPPNRFGNSSEISVIQLVPGNGKEAG